jgi:SAM-dependent methyltransferase
VTAPASRSFERVAHLYDASRGGEERGRRMARDVASRLGPPGDVLDVGVGTGVVSLGLKERGWQPVGIDLSPAMAARARDRLGDVVVVGDASRMPIASESVGGALSVWVLHLVVDVAGVLREVARVLRPGARYVIVSVDQREERGDPISAIMIPVMNVLQAGRVRNYLPPAVLELATGAGFDVVEVGGGARHEYEDTPGNIAQNIEDRAYSWLWDVPEERWAGLVAPAIEALRALPHPDLPVRLSEVPQIVVLERP